MQRGTRIEKALQVFYRNIELQGGDLNALSKLRGTWRSPFFYEVRAEKDGVLTLLDAREIGMAGIYLGVGRNRTEDTVSPTAGFIFDKKRGDVVRKGERIVTMYGKDEQSLGAAIPFVERSLSIEQGSNQPGAYPSNSILLHSLILEEITTP